MDEVRPTFMANPSHIWFIHKPDRAYERRLTDVMKGVELLGRRQCRQLWHAPTVGEVVMLWCPKARVWGRAQIHKIFWDSMHEPDSTVVVFLIDYGTSVTAKLLHVRELPEDPEFRVPGKACKLILYGIVPITKIPLFIPEEGTYGLHDDFAKIWDRSTYDFMANILSTDTQFYVKLIDFEWGKTTCLQNRVFYGDLLMLVDGNHQSISAKLTGEKYGIRNMKKFKEFFVAPNVEESNLCMGPDKPVCAKVWQTDVDKLVEDAATIIEDTCTPDGDERMDPFVDSPEEIERAANAALIEAEKVREKDQMAQALTARLLDEKKRSEELKVSLRPPPFADRMRFLMEEEQLRNSAKELAGVVPVWEELSSEGESIVHYRTVVDPSNIFVVLTKNAVPFAKLQDEIASFAARHPWLLGQVVAKAGAYCLAMFPEEKVWYRARITTVLPERQVEVFFLDVGDDTYLNGYTEILPISKSLMTMLPFQAIECSLLGIEPVGEEDWSEESTDAVCQYCLDDSEVPLNLRARLHDRSRALFTGGSKFQVVLTHLHPFDDQVMSLNETLLQLPSVRRDVNETSLTK